MGGVSEKLRQAERLDVVTQKIGFVLWQLQELEGCAAQVFVLLAQAEKGMGLPAGEALVEKALANTFGATVRKMTSARLLPQELQQRFLDLLKERNWLVHSSRRTSRSAIHSDDAAQRLLDRLDTIGDESLRLIKQLGSMAESHVRSHGITEAEISSIAANLLDKWHSGDAI